MKKNIFIIAIILLLILILIVWQLMSVNNNPNSLSIQDTQPTVPVTESTSPTPQSTTPEEAKIISTENLCTQITKEFITEVTGIAIERVSSLNGPQINACDYYLTNDTNAPYIAIVINKNLNFEKHRQIAINNKLIIKTDPRILGNHYIAWADHETRISNINLYIDENSFLRLDKNVERAIDNDGMIKLASALSKRL